MSIEKARRFLGGFGCAKPHTMSSDLLTTIALLWAIAEPATGRQLIRLTDVLPALVELGLHAVAVRLAVSKSRSLQVGGDVPRLGVSDQLVGRRIDQTDHGVPALGLRPKLELVAHVGLNETPAVGALLLPHDPHLLVRGAVLRAGLGGNRLALRRVDDARTNPNGFFDRNRGDDRKRGTDSLASLHRCRNRSSVHVAEDSLFQDDVLLDRLLHRDHRRGGSHSGRNHGDGRSRAVLDGDNLVDGVLAFRQVHHVGAVRVHLRVTPEKHPLATNRDIHVSTGIALKLTQSETLHTLRTVTLGQHRRLVTGDLVAFRSSKACGHAFEDSHRGSLRHSLGGGGRRSGRRNGCRGDRSRLGSRSCRHDTRRRLGEHEVRPNHRKRENGDQFLHDGLLGLSRGTGLDLSRQTECQSREAVYSIHENMDLSRPFLPYLSWCVCMFLYIKKPPFEGFTTFRLAVLILDTLPAWRRAAGTASALRRLGRT